MSRQNNVGSVPSVDYHNYDYASHRANPFGPNNGNGMHSSLDAFRRESQSDKEMSLGYGTNSAPESEERHKAAMKAVLAAIEEQLMQEPAQGGAGQP